MLSCVAASLLLVIVTVNLWPVPSGEEELADLYSSTGQEVIEIAEIIPTRQEKRQPPPPAPLPPIEVSDEDLIENVELELDSPLTSTDVADDEIVVDATADESSPLPKSQTQAKLVRFAPPRYPDEAKRRKIRAEILVEVDVDERGVVQNARIVRRFLLQPYEFSALYTAEDFLNPFQGLWTYPASCFNSSL